MTVRNRDGRWTVDVDYEHPDGTRERIRKASPVNTRRGAEEYERQIRQTLLDPNRHRKIESPNFQTFVADRWWPTYPRAVQNRPSTVREKRFHLDCHILPFFGSMRLENVSKESVEKFVASRTVGPKRVKNLLATLRRILVSAEEWGVLREVPDFPKIRISEADFDFYTKEESENLLAGVSGLERCILLFALRTGARAGEQLALEWSDVDFERQEITLRQSIARGEEWTAIGEARQNCQVVTGTKSGKVRRVPMSTPLLSALADIKQGGSSRVFPFSSKKLLLTLGEACRESETRELRWHDLRHSFASQLAIAGVPLPQIQKWMGHSTITMTMRYAHLAPGGGREFIAALG